jgi:cytochrome c oxidase subunit 3
VVQISHRYGMIMFIASEVMFFVAWFWAYFDVSLFATSATQFQRTEFIGAQWPPKGIEVFDPFHLPLINTLILLISGCAATWAHHALVHENNRKDLQNGLIVAILLGVLFTAFQIYEYTHAAFGFAGNIYGANFFMATGFHGFHVLIGTIFLAVCLFRVMKGHFTPERHVGFEAAAWYWHFVDVVWLGLYVIVYWL